MLIANAPLNSMLNVLLDLIINHKIGNSATINKSLQLCFMIFLFIFLITLPPNQYKMTKIVFGRPSTQNQGRAQVPLPRKQQQKQQQQKKKILFYVKVSREIFLKIMIIYLVLPC